MMRGTMVECRVQSSDQRHEENSYHRHQIASPISNMTQTNRRGAIWQLRHKYADASAMDGGNLCW